jgi:hypothetical protein
MPRQCRIKNIGCCGFNKLLAERRASLGLKYSFKTDEFGCLELVFTEMPGAREFDASAGKRLCAL